MTLKHRIRPIDPGQNWLADNPSGSRGPLPIDPDEDERRDQRIGTLSMMVAYGAIALAIIGGLAAIAAAAL
jgi:hypothetical protein